MNKEVEKIQARYLPTERTKLDDLKDLDKKVKRPALVLAYVVGILGALILGTGMCLAMEVIGDMIALGVAIGVVGIAVVVGNYYLYGAVLSFRKKKYASQIMELSNQILNA